MCTLQTDGLARHEAVLPRAGDPALSELELPERFIFSKDDSGT